MAGDHTDEESLERYSMGVLGAREAEPLEEHLLIFQGCRERLNSLDEYHRAMRAALKTLSPRSPSFGRKRAVMGERNRS